MTYEEIKEFIKYNNITGRYNLLKISRTVYNYFKELSKEEQEKLLPPLNRLSYLSELNTVSDFKTFVKTNNIKSRSQLDKEFPSVYIKFKKTLTVDEKEMILPSKNKSCNITPTESGLREFIKENNITSRDDFRKRFPAGYSKFLTLNVEERDKLLPKTSTKYTNIVTKADVLNFISTNNITSRSELYKNYSIVYGKFLKLFTKQEQAEIYPLKSYEDLNTVDDFSRFIQENKIISRGDFSKRFRNGYEKFMRTLSKEDRDLILPSLVQQDYTKLITKEDFKNFLLENNIKSRKEFDTMAYKGYVRFKERLTVAEQNELLPPRYRDYSSLEDFDSFKRFIEENNVVSRRDLDIRFGGAYQKFLDILDDEERETLLPTIKSLGEKQLRNLLDTNSIGYETEKTFLDLRGDGDVCLRYDFYLPDYNILLEYHGSQHFNPKTGFYTDRGIELDHIKYDYAKDKQIPLLYFTSEVYVYNRFGYFTEVITDENILIQKIKEIGMTNQSNS